jgi:hypothetical protein
MLIPPASAEFPICEICKTDLTQVLEQHGEIGAFAHHAKHAIEQLQKAVNAGEALVNTLTDGRMADLPIESKHAAEWFRQQLEICEEMGVVPRERIITMEQVS